MFFFCWLIFRHESGFIILTLKMIEPAKKSVYSFREFSFRMLLAEKNGIENSSTGDRIGVIARFENVMLCRSRFLLRTHKHIDSIILWMICVSFCHSIKANDVADIECLLCSFRLFTFKHKPKLKNPKVAQIFGNSKCQRVSHYTHIESRI